MASVIVLYTAPDDDEGFAAHYREHHVPLVAAMPDLDTFAASRILGTPRGTEAPYAVKAELHFPSAQQMQASLRSDAGMAVSRDAMQMCRQFGMQAEIMLADDF